MGTWKDPEPEVVELCKAVDEDEVTLHNLRDSYRGYKSGVEIYGEYSETIVSLAEKESYGATMATVERHIASKKINDSFPWGETRDKDKIYNTDMIIDENISEDVIIEKHQKLGDIGEVVSDLMGELPSDMSEDTEEDAKRTLAGKCGRVLDL